MLRRAALPKLRFALPALLCVFGVATLARAHESEIDQLRLWVEPGGTLRAQLILDPKLTRPHDERAGAVVSDAEARTRLRAFVATNLVAELDGTACEFEVTIRELYVLGGATPGDLAMLQCTPRGPVQHMHLTLGAGFQRLAVDAVGFVADDATSADALSPLRIVPGEAVLSFTRRAPAMAGSDVMRDTVVSDDVGVAAWFATAARFVGLGVQHIVPFGFDHVLFVLGLTLRELRLRALLWPIAAFTVAHTVTLALGVFGVLSASPHWVEPMIALSIVVVALANLRPRADEQGRSRVALCFGFGLVHGLGFAGALGALDMPRRALLPALLGFNLGVELGQVLVASSALLLLSALRRKDERRKFETGTVQRWLSLAIAAAGLYLLWDRVG